MLPHFDHMLEMFSQVIFIPQLIVPLCYELMNLFAGYQKFVDPAISPEFQAAAIRFGITMAPPGVYMR